MRINDDFSTRATVTPGNYQWVPSPQKGVERVMLDRIGEEKARATSIVRYAPESVFPYHQHPEGEEILVLSGTFSEAEEHYPAGWYMRNPPGSGHQPSSAEGAVIFVKLRQMRPEQHQSVRINTRDPAHWTVRDGGECYPLFEDEFERVTLERRRERQRLFDGFVDGAEILVVDGTLFEGAQAHEAGTWIRLPPGEYPAFRAGDEAVTAYLKRDHIGRWLPEVAGA